jgi:hypothetical protein
VRRQERAFTRGYDGRKHESLGRIWSRAAGKQVRSHRAFQRHRGCSGWIVGVRLSRLELELGVSPFYTHTVKEWDTDLLFKKPWTLSRKAEFMFGIGPQWCTSNRMGDGPTQWPEK